MRMSRIGNFFIVFFSNTVLSSQIYRNLNNSNDQKIHVTRLLKTSAIQSIFHNFKGNITDKMCPFLFARIVEKAV